MTINFFRKLALATGAAAVLLLTALPSNSAENAADYFKQNVITLYVGFERGNDHDRYSRMLARHLGRHLPGNPLINVKNSPGAGSHVLAKMVYGNLPQDGSVIANVGRRIGEPLLGAHQAEFDGSKFNWLGSMNNDVSVCAVWHQVPLVFWRDIVDKGATMGGINAESESHTAPLLLNNVLRTNMALVTGYPNDAYVNTAIERGELDGRCGWSWTALKSKSVNWLEDKKIRILVQMSGARHPALPKIPLITDFAETKTELEILKLAYASRLWGRPYLVGPRVPRARVKILRTAFDKAMTDPRLLNDATRQKLDLAWVDGPTVQNAIAKLYDYPNSVITTAAHQSTDPSHTRVTRAVIPTESTEGRITALKDGGHALSWAGNGKKGIIRVIDNRTKILIGGRKAARKALKLGMRCVFTFRASSARKIYCR